MAVRTGLRGLGGRSPGAVERLFRASLAQQDRALRRARQVRTAILSRGCDGHPEINLGNGSACSTADGQLVQVRVEKGVAWYLSPHLPRALRNTGGVVAHAAETIPVPPPAAVGGGEDELPALPEVETLGSEDVAEETATLLGRAVANGLATSVHFEWGATTAYGNETVAEAAGVGYFAVDFFADLEGLDENTTYHFRAVAVSAAGTVYGVDMTFRTDTLLPDFTPDYAKYFHPENGLATAFGTHSITRNDGSLGRYMSGVDLRTLTIPSGWLKTGTDTWNNKGVGAAAAPAHTGDAWLQGAAWFHSGAAAAEMIELDPVTPAWSGSNKNLAVLDVTGDCTVTFSGSFTGAGTAVIVIYSDAVEDEVTVSFSSGTTGIASVTIPARSAERPLYPHHIAVYFTHGSGSGDLAFSALAGTEDGYIITTENPDVALGYHQFDATRAARGRGPTAGVVLGIERACVLLSSPGSGYTVGWEVVAALAVRDAETLEPLFYDNDANVLLANTDINLASSGETRLHIDARADGTWWCGVPALSGGTWYRIEWDGVELAKVEEYVLP